MGVEILMLHPFLSLESREGDLYLDVLVKGLMHETGSEYLVIRTLKKKSPNQTTHSIFKNIKAATMKSHWNDHF